MPTKSICSAKALSTALQEFARTAPAEGCPWEVDVAAANGAADHVRAAQQRLLEWCQHQARLIYVNGHDHLTSMSRLLGSDGGMSLFAHVTLSRSVCEAAVRHSWLLDPSISYEERITRSAAMLSYNIGNRLKGARQAFDIVYDRNGRDVVGIKHPGTRGGMLDVLMCEYRDQQAKNPLPLMEAMP